MIIWKSLLKANLNTITAVPLALFLLGSAQSFAQKKTDSTKSLLLADRGNPMISSYARATNVVYPALLKGNEAESLQYIEQFSNNRREYLLRMHKKGKNYLPKAASILKKYDLPTELKVLLALESAYNANAVSKAGAVGYWQIMDIVAKEYGMKYIAQQRKNVNKKGTNRNTRQGKKKGSKKVTPVDDRRNFNIATHAAARYLRDRRRNLDDNWLLVVASYNCGVGNVWNAMKKSKVRNPDFWDIKKYLPAETQSYVMNFIALNVIFHNYDLFVTNKLRFTPQKIVLPGNFDGVLTEQNQLMAEAADK